MASQESWSVARWPANVFPHTPSAARHLIARNRTALANEKVITRIGRTIVVDGARWRAWLFKHSDRVANYTTKGVEVMNAAKFE